MVDLLLQESQTGCQVGSVFLYILIQLFQILDNHYVIFGHGIFFQGIGAGPYLPDPNPSYVEKIQYDPKNLEGLKKIYVRCTKSVFGDTTRPAKEKIDARNEEWIYYELP